MNVIVIGGRGFVGSAIARALSNNCKYSFTVLGRGEVIADSVSSAEIIIHAGNPARRFRAESDPTNDFFETANKTFEFLNLAGKKKFILVSSLSCRTQLNTSYGRNRRFCEMLVISQGGIVIRLGPMYGGGRTEDVLHDILTGKKVYVSPETRYAYVDVDWAAEEIVKILDATSGIYEIGACNSISLREIKEYFGSSSFFSGEDDTQIPESENNGPNARLVLDYAKSELDRLNEWA